MQEATLRALKSFAVLMPKVRQAILYEALTQTTPADIDAWIEASFQQRLTPGTIETRLRVVQGVFTFWRDQGHVAQSPIRRPRHQLLVPQGLPRPMGEDEVVAFFLTGCEFSREPKLLTFALVEAQSERRVQGPQKNAWHAGAASTTKCA
jgi:site-specific recombinase XerD